MYPVDIDVSNQSLSASSSKVQAVLNPLRGTNAAAQGVRWDALTSVQFRRMPSLFDEIGMVLESAAGQLYVRETQQGYAELFDALEIEKKLPGNWYARVEKGETFTVQLGD